MSHKIRILIDSFLMPVNVYRQIHISFTKWKSNNDAKNIIIHN